MWPRSPGITFFLPPIRPNILFTPPFFPFQASCIDRSPGEEIKPRLSRLLSPPPPKVSHKYDEEEEEDATNFPASFCLCGRSEAGRPQTAEAPPVTVGRRRKDGIWDASSEKRRMKPFPFFSYRGRYNEIRANFALHRTFFHFRMQKKKNSLAAQKFFLLSAECSIRPIEFLITFKLNS